MGHLQQRGGVTHLFEDVWAGRSDIRGFATTLAEKFRYLGFFAYICRLREKSIKNYKYGRRENYIFDGWREQGAQQQ